MADAVRRTLERELGLVAEPGFRLPDLEGKPLPSRSSASPSHDTADRRLLAAGITLRRRVESRKGLWQLELPSVGGRLELESGGRELSPELVSLLAGVIRGRELQPVGVLRTQRDGVRVTRDGGVADVTHDVVSVLEKRRTTGRFGEVEIELVSGDANVLDRLGRELRKSGAKRHDGRPKIAQALLPASPPGPPAADASTQAHVQAMLEAQYMELVAHDPGVRLGDDAEDLHRMRVATRRLRAILRAGRGVVEPEWADGLRNDVAWLGAQLGPVRDSDVLHESIANARDGLDERERKGLDVLLRILRKEAGDARERLAEAIQAIATSRCSTRSSLPSRRRASPAMTPQRRQLQRASFGSCAVRYVALPKAPRTRSSTLCGSVASALGMRQSSPKPREARRRRASSVGPRSSRT